ncbi:MAG TPA: response regulator [Burkholderiales bacterium]
MLYRILLVDDDRLVLQALRRELMAPPHIGHDGLEIEAFEAPGAAIERARESDGYFDLVISDYQMPEMDGITLLGKLRAIQPDTTRVLLTGHMDLEVVERAINEARVDYLIRKPWSEYDLKARIALALHQRDMALENRQLLQAGGAPPQARAPGQSYQLMLVDDEPAVLRSLERELSMGGAATAGRNPLFTISTFSEPQGALSAAAKQSVDIVIADYQMPAMDGIRFLREIRQHRPDAVRILMSGKATIGVLLDAVNVAGIYHFLGKPWEADELKLVIGDALRYHDVLVESNRLAAGGAAATKA